MLQDLGNGKYKTHSPDGYIFYLIDKDKAKGRAIMKDTFGRNHVVQAVKSTV